jgi:hypothetical protein
MKSHIQAEHEDVLRKLELYEQVLWFYADSANYSGEFYVDSDGYEQRWGFMVLEDEGTIAREALGISKDETPR